ncbi:plastocyanin/azurin family copper-binding protein [Solirubrobacter phytolaccae]|uniref:Plastocyanin/azurin family copper-binding protein n=1 Tax=Solirubrobacter phytolaccae TaxID=1404360 RepID=A0A9X3NP15_9ACTN|nr:plastocyanin/azurin family copper-binding protein [Solirubrobacter phytolaccae]MDA0184992.1 plastocyanin/azurin family copper-binding protein [Solirubrobacter phytolaccae]
MRRALFLLATLGALAALAAPASGSVERYRLRHGPTVIGAYQTVYPRGRVHPPPIDGFITGMHARLVDRRGRPVTIRDVMLHHVFFHRARPEPTDLPCAGKHHEAFYGTGEEDQRLRLPDGYGYPVHPNDKWRMGAMLMSHTGRTLRVYIEYTVEVETRKRLTPVQAFWLRANGCEQGAGYHIRGDGAPGSSTESTSAWTAPYDLRIVAAGGHLHGGAQDLWLSEPGCGDRRLLDNRPSYAMPDHLYYRARPVLHEPGPIDTRYFTSRTGIPVRAGESVLLSARYGADRPRTVMAVMHLYVARAPVAKDTRCAPLPADATHATKPGATRSEPPWTPVPLTGLDERGRAFTILDPPWPSVALADNAEVVVDDSGFVPRRFSLRRPGTVKWRFTGSADHNVRLADGPRLIVTPVRSPGQTDSSTFTAAGRYTLFCTQHPVTMHAVVDVHEPG